jgi:small conductance mechanosensitive channel
MTQGELDSLYVYAAVPFSVVFGTRFVFTFLAAAAAAVLFLIGASRIQRVKITRISAGNESPDPAMNGHGELTRIAGETGRKKERRPGSRITPEDRTTALLMRIIQGVGAVMAVVLLFRDRLLPENSMIRFVMDETWPRGMNVYAVTAIMILMLTAMVGVTMVLGVLRILSRILSPRAETICRLLRSAVEYISVLAVAYAAFSFLGVRVETLITTTSVMALLVGMGAQDLTQDIIAGLFLMFESEFQVGDVIDTGGKIGIVREIGLHSTKLIDMNNNVLIISNSKLADIINRTQRTSFAFVDFTVSSEVKIRDLEALFKEKLPPLKKKYPKLIGAPYFRGVSTFSGATMKCGIAAEVMEKDRIPMERNLNKEVLRILQDASISPM